MPDFLDHSDYLARSSTLREHAQGRTNFDPANPEHQASLKKFLETGSWGVMFFLEFPFTDVPTYVLSKFASYQLGAVRQSQAKRALSTSGISRVKQAEINMEKGELLEDPQE